MVNLVEVQPLSSVDDPNAWAAVAQARLWNAENLALLGYDDLNDTDTAAVRWAVRAEHRTATFWIALSDADDRGSAVGAATLHLPLKDNLNSAGLSVVVDPRHRRQGIGTELLAAAEARAASEGRTVLQSWATQAGQFDPDAPTALVPKEGSGAVDGQAPASRFLLGYGYTLEQVEVHSMLRLPVEDTLLNRLEAEAAAKVGNAYRLLTWAGRCPDQLVDAFARLRVAMADAPTAGIQYESEHWDAARVRDVEQRVAESGLLSLTAVAQHAASGELAGYTELQRFTEREASAIQEDTVVIAAHRGHRLGMWLKTANLRRLSEAWPAVRRVHTWNADENDHMRSINIALGFRPESGEGGWQKVV